MNKVSVRELVDLNSTLTNISDLLEKVEDSVRNDLDAVRSLGLNNWVEELSENLETTIDSFDEMVRKIQQEAKKLKR